MKLPAKLLFQGFFEVLVGLIGEDRLYPIKARSCRSEQLQSPLRFMISGRMYDQALKQPLRIDGNVSFSATGLP
ncbi:hypothetical protein [Salinibacter ruber]|uniref:hypothetical protein n=1 Tax=Salinibacter ruber TaxID=146919 RepID=UPI001F071F11|nr:hypothetical protein [Salinibacter ruber]